MKLQVGLNKTIKTESKKLEITLKIWYNKGMLKKQNSKTNTQKTKLPQSFKPYLWSYDFSKIDPQGDKKIIITQVLNFGTKEATDELFSMYKKEEIIDAIKHPMPGMWNKKSLNYWSLALGVQTKASARKVK